MFAQFATIISAAVVLILAMTALFYQTCLDVSCPTDPNSKLTPVPLWVYVSAPILPTVLVAYGVLLATVQGLRSYYIRTIEVRIHQLTNQDHSNLPIPSWGHLQIDVTGNAHSRGFARLSWLLIDIIILLLIVACIYLAISKIAEIRHRVFALVVDMSLLVIPFATGVASSVRGARLWEQTRTTLPERLRRTNAQFPSTRVLTERSLASFLLLPRNQEELLKALFIPISFLIGWLLGGLPNPTAETLWYLFGFLFTFEFLVYQARYLLNDVRDRRVDCSGSLSKRRFPCSRIDDPVALKAAFVSFVARLAFAVLLVGCIFPLENWRWAWHLGFLAGVLLIAVPYETARSKCVAAAKAGSKSRTKKWGVAVVGLVGLGYGLRSVVGLWLAGVEGTIALGLAAVAGSLLGSTFVALAWALESTRTGEDELANKAHLVLFRSAVSKAAERLKLERFGPTDKVLVGRQSLTAPWCVTAILATVALVGFSLFLLHHSVSVVKSLWIGGAVVMVAGLAVVTPVRLSWKLTICNLVGVGIVLHVLSVSVIQSIMAAVVSALALIMTCVHRGMCFEDMTECVSKVVTGCRNGWNHYIYEPFTRTR
jgi:hypothetical protein